MTTIDHFLVPGGWTITKKSIPDQACSEVLPVEGSTIMIGRSRRDGAACTLTWMDKNQVLRTIDNLVPRGDYWEVEVKHEQRFYLIRIWKNENGNGKPGIIGTVQAGRRPVNVLVAPADGVGGNAQGTWGAEANPGSGGGGGGRQGGVKPTAKRKR